MTQENQAAAGGLQRTIVQALAERRRRAAEQYWQILARSAQPRPGDEDSLIDAMALLGRKPDDLPADLEVVARTVNCEALAEQEERLRDAHNVTHKVWTDAIAWSEQARADLERKIAAKLLTAETDKNRTQGVLAEATTARNELDLLRDKWAALVAGVSLESIRDAAREVRMREARAIQAANKKALESQSAPGGAEATQAAARPPVDERWSGSEHYVRTD